MNGAQGQPPQGQTSGGQPANQPAPRLTMFRPADMRTLPDVFSHSEKQKWEVGLTQLWKTIQENDQNSTPHQEAKKKLFEFSRTLHGKLNNIKAVQNKGNVAGAAAGAAAAGGAAGGVAAGGVPRPQSQGAPANGAVPNGRLPIPQHIVEHMRNMSFLPPATTTIGSQEAQVFIAQLKDRYQSALVQMDRASQKMKSMRALQEKRVADGNPFSAEETRQFNGQKEATEKMHGEAKAFVEKTRSNQNEFKTAHQANGAAAIPTPNNAQAAARPGLSLQQPANPVAMQNTQTVNAAMEAARAQQQNGGARPPQNGQAPTPTQSTPTHMMQQQGGPVQGIKQEAGVPQINTQIGRAMPTTNSPRSAIPQSATSNAPQSATTNMARPPQALTHPQALQSAARTYSSGQTSGTPNVMGAHSQPSHMAGAPRETNNVMTHKMPIPKFLAERSAQLPQPVTMAPSRPSYSGGPNGASNGMVGQPSVQKLPGYNVDGDENRVLAKKKLDELVKQVTGGGDGQGSGEGLSPEVEESILTVADTFVDQVLQAACKNAKERGSTVLEIRDIQLTLERGYNIRIPGYASDEIRTVRKMQPASQWINKMSAVQASKVTGGRGDN